jgi:hypothetical protein
MGRSVPPAIQKVNDVNETSKKAMEGNGKRREDRHGPRPGSPLCQETAKNYYSRPRCNIRAEENVGFGNVHGHTGILNMGRALCRETDGDENADPEHAIVLNTFQR